MDRQLEFILKATNDNVNTLREDFKQDIALLRSDIHDLYRSKWIAFGAGLGVTSVISVLTTLITIYLKTK